MLLSLLLLARRAVRIHNVRVVILVAVGRSIFRYLIMLRGANVCHISNISQCHGLSLSGSALR